MFEKTLSDKLQRIFALKKATFDQPSESREQECLFIEVESARSSFKDGNFHCRVQGRCVVHASSEKLPFGYFPKRIAESAAVDTKDLFFYEVEENTRLYQNIVERSFSFVYFFNSQYDPDVGTLNSIAIEVST